LDETFFGVVRLDLRFFGVDFLEERLGVDFLEEVFEDGLVGFDAVGLGAGVGLVGLAFFEVFLRLFDFFFYLADVLVALVILFSDLVTTAFFLLTFFFFTAL
jgi:hypothetical protein